MLNKVNTMIDKLNVVVSEKSEKVMTNKKVEGMVNGIGAMATFLGAIAFGIVFIMCTASLMKTGKNYVVRPTADTAVEEGAEAEIEAEAEAEGVEDAEWGHGEEGEGEGEGEEEDE